jgi:transposase-like protein
MDKEPCTLKDAVVFFSNPDNCMSYLLAHRPEWKDGVVCPTCGSKDIGYISSRRMFQCKGRHPKAQFTVKVGTIMEDSALPLDKWLIAIWMLTNCKNGASSWEIHRALGITQKCAWHMLHRIRLALQDPDTGGKIGGEGKHVEADASFIGGLARYMHANKRAEKIKGTGPEGKAIVAAVPERGGKIRARMLDTRKKRDVQALVREHVEAGSTLHTDALKSHEGLDEYTHNVIDHAVRLRRWTGSHQ